MVKKGYYGNEASGLAWDHVKVPQTTLYITTTAKTQYGYCAIIFLVYQFEKGANR